MKAWAAAVAVVMTGDLLWLGVLMRGFYRARFGHLMADSVVWPAALAFYLLYGAGIVHFAARRAAGPGEAAVQGALLGLLAYGVYDLTNLAVLRGWDPLGAAVDVAWGVALTAAAAAAAAKLR